MTRMRLQKFLALVGLGSRRACETLIAEGRISVDGTPVTKLGTTIDPDLQKVAQDGVPLKMPKKVYLLVNKPVGYICSSRRDRTDRPLVLDLVEKPGIRLFTVGRLDVDSKGAIILTNDGDFANIVAHPRYDIPKTYKLRVRGQLTEDEIEMLRKGVWLAEGKATPIEVRIIKRLRSETIVRMTLKEGKNRIIRRVMAKAGFKVIELERTRIGPVALGSLKTGRNRNLNSVEIKKLLTAGTDSFGAAGKGAARKRRGRRKVQERKTEPGTGPARSRQTKGKAAGSRAKPTGPRKTGKKKVQRPPAARRKTGKVQGKRPRRPR